MITIHGIRTLGKELTDCTRNLAAKYRDPNLRVSAEIFLCRRIRFGKNSNFSRYAPVGKISGVKQAYLTVLYENGTTEQHEICGKIDLGL